MNRQQVWKIVGVVFLACGLAGAQRIVTFNAPGAGTGAGQGTLAQGINLERTTYGYYIDASGVAHGFLRSRNGTFATFSAPRAGTASGQGTFAYSLDPAGAITGYYIDGNGAMHGYLRSWRGHFTSFNAPGAGTGSGQGTLALPRFQVRRLRLGHVH